MRYKRIVIKIGTTLLTKENNEMNHKNMSAFIEQIAKLKAKGHEIIFVTSGAVASGRSELTLKKESKTIPFKHALASVGQGILMNTYREGFKKFNIPVAQALLTNNDFHERRNYITIRNTLELLLEMDVLPILNENDVSTLGELTFSSNDILSAYVAGMVGADLLIILSDVEGLYDKNPQLHDDAKLIKELNEINETTLNLTEDSASKKSRGGMMAKLEAAAFASNAGSEVAIASGKTPNIISKIVEENYNEYTHLKAKCSKKESRKNWLQAQVKTDAFIIVDDGAAKALITKGTSLLPSGIIEVEGSFERGDIISIKNKEQVIGIGQTNYPSTDVKLIKGCHSSSIAEKLQNPLEDELIHRDNMVIFS